MIGESHAEPRMDRYVGGAVLDMHAARDELLAALAEVTSSDWSRYVPYGSRTLHELLAHLAGADQVWASAAKGLLKGEGEEQEPIDPSAAKVARERVIQRGRRETPDALITEMSRRRKLLLSLYELLEKRHLALALPSFGEHHNSVRERIWLGYHDRLHAADIRRALRMQWHPQRLNFIAEIVPAVDALSPDATLYVAYSVDAVFWERPSPLPGWTYRQLLAHIATGDWVLQRHLRHVIEQNSVGEWPDIAAGNEKLLEERQFSTHAALIEEYLSMRHETFLLLSTLKPLHLRLKIELWWEQPSTERTLLDYILGFESHDRMHREQLRPAMKYGR